MKSPKRAYSLNCSQLEIIVDTIQEFLWLEEAGVWDSDKEWGAKTMADIGAVMEEYGLRPEAPHV